MKIKITIPALIITAAISAGCSTGMQNSRSDTTKAKSPAGIKGYTPLMSAALDGNLAEVKALITAGADVNAKDSSVGGTALREAVSYDHVDCAKALIAAGADVNARIPNHKNT